MIAVHTDVVTYELIWEPAGDDDVIHLEADVMRRTSIDLLLQVHTVNSNGYGEGGDETWHLICHTCDAVADFDDETEATAAFMAHECPVGEQAA